MGDIGRHWETMGDNGIHKGDTPETMGDIQKHNRRHWETMGDKRELFCSVLRKYLPLNEVRCFKLPTAGRGKLRRFQQFFFHGWFKYTGLLSNGQKKNGFKWPYRYSKVG